MAEKAEFTEFEIDYYNEVNDNIELYDTIDRRLRALAHGHTDITGAQATIRPSGNGKDHDIDATITVYMRPTYLSATEEARTPEIAVDAALDDLERQVRKQREKLRGY